MRFGIKSKNVLTPEGIREAIVIINNGLIEEILEYDSETGCEVMDYAELVVMPGLVDTHVHINEPGRTEWEGFETATKAAAAGGITMLVDMPLNSSPVTTNADALNKKIKAAKNKLYVDCGFYGGVIPGNENELEGLIKNGVSGLKAFMINSGLDEFPAVSEEDLRTALSKIKSVSQFLQLRIPLLVHAELTLGKPQTMENKFSFKSFIDSRPKEMENRAIEVLIKLCREFDYHIHIVHLSSSEALGMIKEAKAEGLKLTVETCPHYLFFSSEEIPDKDTTFKCTPPIRDNKNREELWRAVKEGVIDFIVSDHSPCSPELKCMDEGNFEEAWGGIASLQLGLSAVWTEARKRGFNIEDVSRLMSSNTAAFAGMENKKGKIKKGMDADIVIFDPDGKFITDGDKLFHKHKVTPYSDRELRGRVEATYLRGEKIFENGKIVPGPAGKIILKTKI